MSDEMNKKHFEHYTSLAGGSMKTGNSVKDELIVSDAKRHLADLIKKNPDSDFDGSKAKAKAEAQAKAKAEAQAKAKAEAQAKAKAEAEAKAKAEAEDEEKK